MIDPTYKDPTFPRLERRFDDSGIPPILPKSPHDPERYYQLTSAQKTALQAWIKHAVQRHSALTSDRAISGLSMLSDFAAVAFPINPGAFYGGLMVAGHLPTISSSRSKYPKFQVAPKSPQAAGFWLDHLTAGERAAFDALVAAAVLP